MHCSLTGQPDRVPARYPPACAVSNLSYNHSPASSDLSGLLKQTKALRKLYCQLTSPRIYQDVPLPSGEAARWSTCPSTHRQIIVCTPVRTNLIPTTRPFLPHSPILWFSLAYLRAVRCKCQRVALACWGPCSVESQRPCPTQENLLQLWVGSRSAMDTLLR